jgi:hypothetical protein
VRSIRKRAAPVGAGGGSVNQKGNLCMTDLDNFQNKRNAKRQHQVAHIYAAGPRPVLEALLDVAAGKPLDDVLAAFGRIAISTYHMLGADELPIDRRLQ